MNLFDIVNDLSQHKKNLSNDIEFDKAYVPWIINKAFSNYYDTILYANEINTYGMQDKELQHDYYFYSIKPKKRWSKWNKKVNLENIELIQKFYNVNINKAKEIAAILSDEDFEMLKKKNNKGGIK